MAPIGIKYYKCHNNGTGIIIYPQLRNANEPTKIIWDGRQHIDYSYYLTIGQSVIVDLGIVAMPQSTPFFLSCNVVFGSDDWDHHNTFVYDPKSDLMATGQKYGPVHSGRLEYCGVQSFNVGREAMVVERTS